METQPLWLVADWLRRMEPASGESCPPGRRRRPAAPGEDTVLSPDEKSLHTPTTPTTQGRKQRSPESIPPLTVLKTQPHWLIADWLGLMEPARGESSPSGQRRSPAAPGEDKFPSPGQKSFRISTTPKRRGRKRRSPRSILPRRVWKPQPHWVIADWLGLMEQSRSESCPSGQRRGPAAPGEYWVLSPDQKSFHISITNSNNLRMKTKIPRVDTAPQGVQTPTQLARCRLTEALGASARRELSLWPSSRSRRTRGRP